jgi:acyl carrier protein
MIPPSPGGRTEALVRKAAAEVQLLSADNDLVTTMDSLDMVNLFVELERAFERSIPPEIISPASFGSVATLARTLDQLLQSTRAG